MKTKEKVNLLEIVIFEHKVGRNGLSKSYVVPGKLTLKRGDRVTWKAEQSDLIMFFPDEKLFGKREAKTKCGGKITLKVSEDIRPGRYPYAVYTEKTNDFAEGGSMPVMIIK